MLGKNDEAATDAKIASTEAQLAKLRGNTAEPDEEVEAEAAPTDIAQIQKDLKNAEMDCKDAAKKAKDRPGDASAHALHKDAV